MKTTSLATRRRFLQVSAAALMVSAAPLHAGRSVAHWRGIALGAGARMSLAGVTDREAAPVFAAIEAEISRLERIFSLYRDDSDLARLNRSGTLAAPQPEMLEVLSLSDSLWRASDGRFDPAVQPLWRSLADGRPAPDIAHARTLADWTGVSWSPAQVRLARPGMALTFNGVAQGYITDRIAGVLRARGFGDVMIDMGEVRALGSHPDGRPWRAGIADPGGQIVRQVQLSDRALATSAPFATRIGTGQRYGHIVAPADRAAPLASLVSVSAPRAAVADGLSTAATLMTRPETDSMLAAFDGARLEHHA